MLLLKVKSTCYVCDISKSCKKIYLYSYIYEAIFYEWQNACEFKDILWRWEISMHVFSKEQPCTRKKMVFSSIKHNIGEKCLLKKWCQSNNTITYCTIVPCTCIQSWTIHRTMTYYNLSMYMYLSIAPRWYLWSLHLFLTSIENNKYVAVKTMSTLYEGQVAMIIQSKRKYLYW